MQQRRRRRRHLHISDRHEPTNQYNNTRTLPDLQVVVNQASHEPESKNYLHMREKIHECEQARKRKQIISGMKQHRRVKWKSTCCGNYDAGCLQFAFTLISRIYNISCRKKDTFPLFFLLRSIRLQERCAEEGTGRRVVFKINPCPIEKGRHM